MWCRTASRPGRTGIVVVSRATATLGLTVWASTTSGFKDLIARRIELDIEMTVPAAPSSRNGIPRSAQSCLISSVSDPNAATAKSPSTPSTMPIKSGLGEAVGTTWRIDGLKTRTSALHGDRRTRTNLRRRGEKGTLESSGSPTSTSDSTNQVHRSRDRGSSHLADTQP